MPFCTDLDTGKNEGDRDEDDGDGDDEDDEDKGNEGQGDEYAYNGLAAEVQIKEKNDDTLRWHCGYGPLTNRQRQ